MLFYVLNVLVGKKCYLDKNILGPKMTSNFNVKLVVYNMAAARMLR